VVGTRDELNARAKRYSFQENRKENRADTSRPGAAKGNTTRLNASSLEHSEEDVEKTLEKMDIAYKKIKQG